MICSVMDRLLTIYLILHVIIMLQNGGWNDLICSGPAQGYVCKKDVIVVDTTGANPLLQGCTNPVSYFT